MGDQLTCLPIYLPPGRAEPGTIGFLEQSLEIAQGSDHPVDKVIARILEEWIYEDVARALDKAANQILSERMVAEKDDYIQPGQLVWDNAGGGLYFYSGQPGRSG